MLDVVVLGTLLNSCRLGGVVRGRVPFGALVQRCSLVVVDGIVAWSDRVAELRYLLTHLVVHQRRCGNRLDGQTYIGRRRRIVSLERSLIIIIFHLRHGLVILAVLVVLRKRVGSTFRQLLGVAIGCCIILLALTLQYPVHPLNEIHSL